MTQTISETTKLTGSCTPTEPSRKIKVNEIGVKIPVKIAFLHQSVMVPGCTTNEKTWSETKIKGVKMWWTAVGLYIEVKGVKGTTRGIIPAANVAVAVWDDAVVS